MLPADVQRYVQEMFDPAEQDTAADLLGGAVSVEGRPASDRELRCVLVLSGGTLQGLHEQVDRLASDFRDVIMEAEYAEQDGGWVQVRDLNQPIDGLH